MRKIPTLFLRDPDDRRYVLSEVNSDTQDEPHQWHKRPTTPARRAPRRAEQPHYNRPRCRHGHYIAEGCRTYNCPDGAPHLATD
ncbi:hypothetical protein [Streptomyces cinereoruber]|uniref:hypothetical protein n=1 Tax=Streptomyces cinereoruber TaxID=67260 RepID=UPI00362E941F